MLGSSSFTLIASPCDSPELAATLLRAAEQSPPGEAWKAIVKTYLRPEMCDDPGHGRPLATLAPE